MTLKTTFASGESFTHADINATNGAINDLAARVPVAASVATGESTSSTLNYVDLTTTTDQVTVTVGPSGAVLVSITAQMTNSGSAGFAIMSFAVSGANTIAASDANSIQYKNPFVGGTGPRFGATKVLTGLTPGSTTFKLKFKASGGTATFTNRDISVIPF